jgi:hypothetical protein
MKSLTSKKPSQCAYSSYLLQINGLPTVLKNNHPVGEATDSSRASFRNRGQRRTGLAILELLDVFGPNKLHTSLDIPLDDGTSDLAVPSHDSTSEIIVQDDARFEKLHVSVFAVHLVKHDSNDTQSANGTAFWTLRVKGVVRDNDEKLMFEFIIGTSSEKARNLRVKCRGEMDDYPPGNLQHWTNTTESVYQLPGRRQLRATGVDLFKIGASDVSLTLSKWQNPISCCVAPIIQCPVAA